MIDGNLTFLGAVLVLVCMIATLGGVVSVSTLLVCESGTLAKKKAVTGAIVSILAFVVAIILIRLHCS